MKECRFYRAQGITDEDAVTQVTIHIHEPMPDVDHDQSRAFFASEGAALAEALWSSLPGGTVDALIAALLARRASLLRVRFREPDPEGGEG